MNKFPGSMRQMPILRVSVNDELLASLIDHTNNVRSYAAFYLALMLDLE